MDTNDRMLTTLEAAKLLSISPRTLFMLTKRGDITSTKFADRTVRYDPEDLRNYVARCKANPTWNQLVDHGERSL
jgi:excisionase family DNA binding protein